jgi:hypothetical protein
VVQVAPSQRGCDNLDGDDHQQHGPGGFACHVSFIHRSGPRRSRRRSRPRSGRTVRAAHLTRCAYATDRGSTGGCLRDAPVSALWLLVAAAAAPTAPASRSSARGHSATGCAGSPDPTVNPVPGRPPACVTAHHWALRVAPKPCRGPPGRAYRPAST